MKSTGLFGKNSGRVGGVVYSNYRGEQIVRSYQPQVKNPNSPRQIAQRAKFKLVSQVAASLGRELKRSFVPNVARETGRNAFIKAMLKKTVYSGNQAALPIEDLVLTNSRIQGFSTLQSIPDGVGGALSADFSANARVHIVFVGYNDGGEIVVLSMVESQVTDQGTSLIFEIPVPAISAGFANVRALVYVYEADTTSGTSYDDYEVLGDEATLDDVLRVYSGRVRFSETQNIAVPQNV